MKQPLTVSTVDLKAKLQIADVSSMWGKFTFWSRFSFRSSVLKLSKRERKKNYLTTNWSWAEDDEAADLEQADVSQAAVSLAACLRAGEPFLLPPKCQFLHV